MGLVFLAFFGLYLPIAAVRTRKVRKQHPLPQRRKYYTYIIVQKCLFGALTLYTAHKEHIVLFPRAKPELVHVGLGVLALAGLVACMRPVWRRRVLRGERRIALFSPSTPTERALWTGVSLCAGFFEEVLYRGVMCTLLWRWSGAPPLAVAICVVEFGLAHWPQGPAGAAITGAVGLLMHGLVLATGSLYVAMAVHFVYDLLAGLNYAKLARELGYAPPAEPNATS